MLLYKIVGNFTNDHKLLVKNNSVRLIIGINNRKYELSYSLLVRNYERYFHLTAVSSRYEQLPTG